MAVVCEVVNDDHRREVDQILKLYGFNSKTSTLYESATIGEKTLSRLKRDIDRATDSYDTVYFYQFPMQDTLVVTDFSKKKWRKRVLRQEA